MENKKNRYIRLLWLLPVIPLLSSLTAASAQGKDMSDLDVAKILVRCNSVFKQNSLVSSIFRFLGWLLMKLLAELSSACESLYNLCFKFVDFTSYSKVEQYINKFQTVWIALVCLSILFLGIILIFWQDKKPKFVVNLLIAILVVSSSGFIIDKMNGFLSTSVRKELMGGSETTTATYSIIGNNVRDLIYMDAKVGIANLYDKNEDGIRNYKGVYENLSKKQLELIDINETLDPDDASGDLKKVLSVRPVYISKGLVNTKSNDYQKVGEEYYELEDVYDGVAWTNMLNEYYYRYTVDWLPAYLELLSLIIVYLFMSYKVIRSLYEIAVNRLLAYLYSANLSGGKKILKILDSIKDTYIVLIFTMICIKLYLIATEFISTMNVNGISKGLILLFLAFALLDGPNMVQKLTGIDAGMSDGMGKMMTMFYGSQMAGSVIHTATGMARGAGGLLMKPFSSGTKTPGNDISDGVHMAGEDNISDGVHMTREEDCPVPTGANPNPDRDATENGNPDTGEKGNLSQNRGAAGSDMPDSDNNAIDNGMSDGESGLSDSGMPDSDGTANGDMPENDLSDRTVSPEGVQNIDSSLSDNVSQNPSGDQGISAASGKEELLNGIDPTTGSMAESLASSMENMERDLGGIRSPGTTGRNGGLMNTSPSRHAGSMFSPERHSPGKQDISQSSATSISKAESQVERNMAFKGNDGR